MNVFAMLKYVWPAPRRTRGVLTALTTFLLPTMAFGQSYHLVDNFSTTSVSSATISIQADTTAPKVGAASGRLSYQLDIKTRSAVIDLPDNYRTLPSAGTLKLWIKGDGSTNELQLVIRSAVQKTSTNGERYLENAQALGLPPVKLNFSEWKEVSLDASGVGAGRVIWLDGYRISAPPVPAAPLPDTTKSESSIELDDLRVIPATNAPTSAYTAGLIGPSVRAYSPDIAMNLDLRSFSKSKAKVRARLTMTDRNDNLVVDRDFPIELAAGESRELNLAATPDNLEAFLPPFNIVLDVISTDLPEITTRREQSLVMGNSLFLFDDLSNVTGRWFTAGQPAAFQMHTHNWQQWSHGEGQRYSAMAQTTAALARVKVPDADRATANAAVAGSPTVLGPYAMQINYQTTAIAFSGADRYLPGNAYRMGVWVKGDGSNSQLSALVLDYTDGGDFWPGGWKRTTADTSLCVLNFTDWRYIEVNLPGRGLGRNSPRGSTDDLDFPLEITAFHIDPRSKDDAPQSGSVLIGAIYAHTQQTAANSLSVQIAYDQTDLRYAPAANASAVIQNSWRMAPRQVKATWSLLDHSEKPIASGSATLDIPALKAVTWPIPLAEQAAAIKQHQGPFRLQLLAVDVRDVSVSSTREVIIGNADSEVHFADFESTRGYIGLTAAGVAPPSPGGPIAFTSTAQAHEGKQSLAITWDKGQTPTRFVSIDPALPGVPVAISMWIYGDNSGAIFYPLLGDRRGIIKGAPQGQWNMFLTRSTDGPLQNVVKMDFAGWKKFTFLLPPPQPNYKLDTPTLAFAPNYPLGLHLCVLSGGATNEKGIVFVDDIVVSTHLPPQRRLGLSIERAGESNVLKPGDIIRVTTTNFDASMKRQGQLTASVLNWRNIAVASITQTVDLAPGQSRQFTLAEKLPMGAYILRATLKDGAETLASTEDELLIADLTPHLGSDPAESLRSSWKLRVPLRDRYTFVDEDWDWVEHYPGNSQLDSIRARTRPVVDNGAEPYLLLGYSAYWAAGVGQDQVKKAQFGRRQRDIGHAVDIFLVPENIDDWDSYVREVIRGVGKEVGGFVVWNNPDTDGPMGVKPEKFAQLLASANKYRRAYSPNTPLLIGGMNRGSAIPYLTKLAEVGGLDNITGVNVRLDVGRLSPEDAEVAGYVEDLRAVLRQFKSDPNQIGPSDTKTILLTDLDWAVEKDAEGLTGFDQAAYLVRSDLLLSKFNIQPALSVRNEDDIRLGLGLTYRNALRIPPTVAKFPTYQLRPAWWALARTRALLTQLNVPVELSVPDLFPGRTRALLYTRKANAKQILIVWRNDDPGFASFSRTGVAVESAEDVFGTPATAEKDGAYPVGKVPTVFTLAGSPADVAKNIARLQVFDSADTVAWHQRVLAAFPASGGTATPMESRFISGEMLNANAMTFVKGASEKLTVNVPKDADIILRKQYVLDDVGQSAEVYVNDKSVGVWDLTRSDQQLRKGVRDALFILPRSALAGKPEALVELRYTTAANTISWQILEYRDSDRGLFPLTAVGPLHADQNVGHVRFSRNTIGSPLKIGNTGYASGLGVFAQSLVEYSVNGQFSRFTATIGVDAATEGRGSVIFEVYADGKKVYTSPVMSGLEAPRDIDVDIRSVRRLRLVVTDAGDGNKFDAANWCNPILHR